MADRWGSLVLSKNDQHTKGPGSIVSFFLFIRNTFKNSASVSKVAATVYEGDNWDADYMHVHNMFIIPSPLQIPRMDQVIAK